MLKQLFPRAFLRYLSLPLLGGILDKFEDWLFSRQYTRRTRKVYIRTMLCIEHYLQKDGFQCIEMICENDFQNLLKKYKNKVTNPHDFSSAIKSISSFLDNEGLLKPLSFCPLESFSLYIKSYENYLKKVKGLATKTIASHKVTISKLLTSLFDNKDDITFSNFNHCMIDEFIKLISNQYCYETMIQIASQLRSFLRFLILKKLIPSDFNIQIDITRGYRSKRPVKALPWDKVEAFMQSIDQTTFMGLRDYTMFFMITHYGLRPGDVVDMKLDNINWRTREIHIIQHKTKSPLHLPITDQVANVLIQYLKSRPDNLPFRNLFLRVKAPVGTLKTTAVTEAFKHWSRLSGLNIPYQGSYCLRHSFAVHLLRQGNSIKIIGDLLGHKTIEATNVYLRMSLEDLRGVALSLPDKKCTKENNHD